VKVKQNRCLKCYGYGRYQAYIAGRVTLVICDCPAGEKDRLKQERSSSEKLVPLRRNRS